MERRITFCMFTRKTTQRWGYFYDHRRILINFQLQFRTIFPVRQAKVVDSGVEPIKETTAQNLRLVNVSNGTINWTSDGRPRTMIYNTFYALGFNNRGRKGNGLNAPGQWSVCRAGAQNFPAPSYALLGALAQWQTRSLIIDILIHFLTLPNDRNIARIWQ